MKKIVSLIKASFTNGMNIFKVKAKSERGKKLLPIFLAFTLMFSMWGVASSIYEELDPLNLEYIVLAIFVLFTSFTTLIEGIYKTSSLLFNCKDDDLLFSLPLRRSTVLFLRIFKFYVFELIFNTLFLLPAIVAYVRWVKVDITFYITSVIVLLLLPIIPIVLSCIIGAIIASLSSRFKHKNIIQTITTTIFLLIVFFVSYNMDKFLSDIASHAESIYDFISKIYYPAGLYAELAVNFDVSKLLIFVLINVLLFIVTIFILSKFYFSINSRIKEVSTNKVYNKKKVIIKSRSQVSSLIRKELNTFFETPVFIINAGFSIVIYLLMAIVIFLKFDLFVDSVISTGMFTKEAILSNITVYLYELIVFVSLTSSITSSMISLERKNFNILKSLPISSKKIILSKLLTSMLLVVPAFILGDIIIFIKLKTSIIDMLLIIILTILLPLLSGLMGLIFNIKYPKLDAENDSEVVKQSTSVFMATIMGFIIIIGVHFLNMYLLDMNLSSSIVLIISIIIFTIIDGLLYLYLMTKGLKEFNKLNS